MGATEDFMRARPALDYGLNELHSKALPGQTFSAQRIAEVCGCTKANIERIERQALAHALELMRKRFRLTREELKREFVLD